MVFRISSGRRMALSGCCSVGQYSASCREVFQSLHWCSLLFCFGKSVSFACWWHLIDYACFAHKFWCVAHTTPTLCDPAHVLAPSYQSRLMEFWHWTCILQHIFFCANFATTEFSRKQQFFHWPHWFHYCGVQLYKAKRNRNTISPLKRNKPVSLYSCNESENRMF